MPCYSQLACIEGFEISHFVDWYGLVFEGVEISGRVDWGAKEDTVRGLLDAVRKELKSKLSKSLSLGYGTEFTIMTRMVDCICELSVFHSDAAVGILEASGFTQQSVKDMILYNGNVRSFRRLFEGLHTEFVDDLKTTIAVVGAGTNTAVQCYGFAIVEHLLKWKGVQCVAAEGSGAFGEVLGRLVAKVYNVEYSDSFKPCEVSLNYARTAPGDAEGVYMGFLFGLGVSVMCDYVVNCGYGKMLEDAERNAIEMKVACLFGKFMECCLKSLDRVDRIAP